LGVTFDDVDGVLVEVELQPEIKAQDKKSSKAAEKYDEKVRLFIDVR
jgi:hypothetical protein